MLNSSIVAWNVAISVLSCSVVTLHSVECTHSGIEVTLCASCFAKENVSIATMMQKDAVEDGRVSMESLDRSVLRVLKWKQKLGLL